ncbi:thiamine-phosphate diphosphorylase [Microbacterium mangrovi]|uniref:Thiamine-phosphate synthase n=1 Tax=Microbacterium mangrovi TaxID=1348253 RepID=A0A0B2A686_9MICO|nr:thiamine-phosphate diphosphorylase [Microbacterium mangrovi]
MTALDLSLLLVTDARLCGERGVAAVVAEAVAGGVTAVQVREKHADDRAVLALVEQVAEAIDGRALLTVNDRLDVAVKARERGIRIDGVHLGQNDPSATRARTELGPDAVVGLTANRPEHFAAVSALPPGTVDYFGVGVIRPTATKPDHPEPLGIAGFAALAGASPLPCVAIGGITASDARALRDAGAAGIAVVSAICAASDPRTAAAGFVRAWSGAEAVRR